MDHTRPSALPEFDGQPRPDTTTARPMDEIIGHRRAKQAIMQDLVVRQKWPHLYGNLGDACAGVLLHGPPGTGKTTLIMASAKLLPEVPIYSLSSALVLSKALGESEKNVANFFASAEASGPSIVLVDEAHILCRSSELDSADGW